VKGINSAFANDLPTHPKEEIDPSVPSDSSRGNELSPPSSNSESSLARQQRDNNANDEYEIHDVPRDGLCGYWAILLAIKDEENKANGNQNSIVLRRKSDVQNLLNKLSSIIYFVATREDKENVENLLIGEDSDLLAMATSSLQDVREFEDHSEGECCRKLREETVWLDYTLIQFLTYAIGYDIEVIEVKDSGSETHPFKAVKNSGKK
jgi:hypothetical protein